MNKRAMNPCGMPERQRGFSLLEMLGALAIASALLIGLVSMMDNSLEDMKGQQAAAYQAQLTTAVRRYIAANHAALTSSIPVGFGGNATVVTVNTLRTDGFLPVGFLDLNIYRQQGCALIRQPAAGQIDALVVTTGGTPIGDKDIAAVAANAGQGSGYIAASSPATVMGASWNLATTNYRNVICAGGTALTGGPADAGHLVSRVFQNGDTRADFLYRDDVGVPALNTMNTPILLANNASNRTEGDTCSTDPAVKAIATDSAGELLQCINGKWAYVTKWKAPVATLAQLAAVPKSDGDVRMVMNEGSYRAAYVYDGASTSWKPLAMDINGNLKANDLTVNNVNASGDLVAQNIRSVQDILSGRDLKVGDVGAQVGRVIVGHSVAVGDVNGVAARNPYSEPKAGDVWAGRDAQAQDEMRSGWLIVEKSATVESVFMNYNSAVNWNGQPCNVLKTGPDADRNGNPYRSWPVGTITAEGGGGFQRDAYGNPVYGLPNVSPPDYNNTGRLIYCGPDNIWHYVNP